MIRKLPVYSVSQINSIVKGTIEENLPAKMIVRGQISVLVEYLKSIQRAD